MRSLCRFQIHHPTACQGLAWFGACAALLSVCLRPRPRPVQAHPRTHATHACSSCLAPKGRCAVLLIWGHPGGPRRYCGAAMLRCCGAAVRRYLVHGSMATYTRLFHCVAPVHQVHLPTCIESSMWAQNSLRELWAVSTGRPARPLQGQAAPDIWESSLFRDGLILILILMPESESGPGPICRVP